MSDNSASVFEVPFIYIKVRQEEHVFYLTLARPGKRNAFTPVMVSEMAFALKKANESSEVRVVVIEAEGPVFCAGMDLNVFNNPEAEAGNPLVPVSDVPLAEAVSQLDKPSVALVKGPVIAGGFLIIGECTFVVAGPEASFSLPEVKRGLFPMQVMATLSKSLTQRKLLEMCILGNTYSAIDALEMGLITHLTEDPEMLTRQLAEQISDNAPFAIKKGIEALKTLGSLAEAGHQKYLKTKLEEIRSSEDARAGYEAFKSKSKPVWKNK